MCSFIDPRAFAETKGCDSRSGRSALVVIDMQPIFITRTGFEDESGNLKRIKELVAAQVDAIKEAVKANIPIIFFELEAYAKTPNEYSNRFGPSGKTLGELKAAAGDYKSVKTIRKDWDGILDSKNGYRTELVKYLKQEDVGTLILVGANGGSCVRESVVTSLANGCSVLAYTKGIADFSYNPYIYPYTLLRDFNPAVCAHCRYQITSDRENVIDAMRSGSAWANSIRPASHPTESSR